MPNLGPLFALGVLAACTQGARAEKSPLAPIPKQEAVSTHGPFQMGACETCHQRHDAADPGPAIKLSNDLCYDCHDEFNGTALVRLDKAVHPPVAKAVCTHCHNPHNSRKKGLRL